MTAKKVQSTKNYGLFKRHVDENRPLDLRKHKKLRASMQKYGFLRCFPLVAIRDKDGSLIVKDGQHRLAFAEELNLTVYWLEEGTDFDVAVVNCAQKPWQLIDYVKKHAARGCQSYQEGLDFADQYKLPLSTAFALLAGTTSFSACEPQVTDGTFRVKDRAYADAVAGLYSSVVEMAPALRKKTFVEACMAVCRVDDFDPRRLVIGARKCREKLVNYGTRDAYLDMLEVVYNFGRKQLVPLKIQAVTAMRDRNAVLKRKRRPLPAVA